MVNEIVALGFASGHEPAHGSGSDQDDEKRISDIAGHPKCQAVLGFQLLNRHFGVLDLGWIVLRLGRETNFVGLETLKNVALGNCVYAGVRNGPNARAFLDVNVQDPALRGRLALKPDVLEISGVPKRIEVALDCGGVIHISGSGKDAGANRLRGNAAIPVDHNFRDDILLPVSQRTKP